jgi:hydrogenase maturation protease
MSCKETNPIVPVIETLLIGYGNVLRGDDGAGPALIELLEKLLPERIAETVQLTACTQLTPELAVDIARVRRVLFIDASSMLKPGRITIQRVNPALTPALMGHHFTPETVMAMAQHAFGACSSAWMIAIGAETMELHGQLTTRVAQSVRRLARHLSHHLSRRIEPPAREPDWVAKYALANSSLVHH